MNLVVQNVAEVEAEALEGLEDFGKSMLALVVGVTGLERARHSWVTLRLVLDSEIKALNRDYRGKDESTDVLSFPGDNAFETLGPPEEWELGDVVVSVDTARRQAKQLGHSLATEIRCLLLHGTLHCLGYDHEQDDGEMNQLELELREQLNLE